MKILAIHDGHNASVALYEDEALRTCLAEERLTRTKNQRGWPKKAVQYALKTNNLELHDIDVVVASHLSTLGYIKRKMSLASTYKSIAPKIILGHLYNIYQVFCREQKVRAFARSARAKARFIDHHLGHAASAYYDAGYRDALVVTIDWLGDSLSHTAYSVKNGTWSCLVRGDSHESLGAFYAAVTEGLGFRPNRHEGKVVGLAAIGDHTKIPKEEDAHFVIISEDNKHFRRNPYKKMVARTAFLAKTYTREDVAAYAQHRLEVLVTRHIKTLQEETGHTHLALAGGVFANVKLNQRIIETCNIDDVFIQPAMGDDGIPLGGAAHYLYTQTGKRTKPRQNVYYGNAYTTQAIQQSLDEAGYTYETHEDAASFVADAITSGNVIGWFNDGMEYGPRALGARSILADPRIKDVKERINAMLKRSDFMPFAPSALEEEAQKVFENLAKGKRAAHFMTITFPVKKIWHEKMPAVVHVDGTARPQLVSKKETPAYHRVIDAFFKKTGVPCVINTSFNMHEEPIVASPEDALRAFEAGGVDMLVFNNTYIVTKKRHGKTPRT